MKSQVVFILSLLTLSGCVMDVPLLTPEGSRVRFIEPDILQKLPGQPVDKCRVLGQLVTENTFQCFSTDDFGVRLRNMAAPLNANLVIVTRLIDPGVDCHHQAQGMAFFCDKDTLNSFSEIDKVIYEVNEPDRRDVNVNFRSRAN